MTLTLPEFMEKLRTEGVIIRGIPFKDYDCILSLFTPNDGLIKLFVKGAYHSKNGKGSLIAPLSQIEAVYTKKQSELLNCYEIAMVNPHHHVRQNLSMLEAACEMLKAIESTQLPAKAAPDLYRLFLIYLKKLPEASDPTCISSSFHLKTLSHEGLLASNALFKMAAEERELIEVLALCRDFSLLSKLTIDPALASQVKQLFHQSL